MEAKSHIAQRIHEEAKAIVKSFKKCEADLIDILVKAERHKVHRSLGFSSLFKYSVDGLGLSPDVASIFITVARKVAEVPELGVLIRAGKVSVSKAKRLTAVINMDNQAHWLRLAETCSKGKLEKLVAIENPRAAVVEKVTYVARDRMELQVGVSEKFMLNLRRTQDVLSQKRRRPASLEEALAEAVEMYLERHDALSIANRQKVKGRLVESQTDSTIVSDPEQGPGPVPDKKNEATPRQALSAATRHRPNIKFQSQCSYTDDRGIRCDQRKFLEVHHINPLSQGGTDELATWNYCVGDIIESGTGNRGAAIETLERTSLRTVLHEGHHKVFLNASEAGAPGLTFYYRVACSHSSHKTRLLRGSPSTHPSFSKSDQ